MRNRLAVAAVILTIPTAPAVADRDHDPNSGAPLPPHRHETASPITDHFYIRGTFYDPQVKTNFRVDQSFQGMTGTPVNGENDLGLPNRRHQGRVEFMFRLRERSKGKDTITGHWEMAGVITEVLFATIPVLPVALAGWWIVGRRVAAAAYGAAGLPLILHLGGTVMHLGGAGIALSLFAVLVPTYLLAGVLLAILEPRIARALNGTSSRATKLKRRTSL